LGDSTNGFQDRFVRANGSIGASTQFFVSR
jgi:hypothetical protein